MKTIFDISVEDESRNVMDTIIKGLCKQFSTYVFALGLVNKRWQIEVYEIKNSIILIELASFALGYYCHIKDSRT